MILQLKFDKLATEKEILIKSKILLKFLLNY